MGGSLGKRRDRPPELSLSIEQRNRLLKEFRGISAELDAVDLMRRTIQAILSLLPVERASVFLVDRANGVMRTFNTVDVRHTVVGGGRKTTANSAVTIPIDSGIAGAIVQSAKSEIVPDAHDDSRFNASIDSRTGFHTRNIISVPVLVKNSEAAAAASSSDFDSRDSRTTSADYESSVAAHVKHMERDGKQTVVAVLQALNREGDFGPEDVAILELLATLLSGVLGAAPCSAASLLPHSTPGAYTLPLAVAPVLACCASLCGAGRSSDPDKLPSPPD
jgi:GAF domain-containing protein